MLLLTVAALLAAALHYARPAALPRKPRWSARWPGSRVTARLRARRLPNDFRSWVRRADLPGRKLFSETLAVNAPEFVKWVETAPDDQLAALLRDVSGFAASVDLSLSEVVTGTHEGFTREVAEDTIGLYCLAAWMGRRIGPSAFYTAWKTSPDSPERRAFAGVLYRNLVAAGLAETPAGLLMASDQQREMHVMRAINFAALHHRAAFLTAVETALAQRGKLAKNVAMPKPQLPDDPRPAPSLARVSA